MPILSEPPKLALIGLGRMGLIHAVHALELAREGRCTIAALVDADPDRARSFAAETGCSAPVFSTVRDLAAAGVANASVVVTPTNTHREHAGVLIGAGQRVLLEKPLTGSLESDREFAGELDRAHPHALMLALQRRFDAPLQYAKELIDTGAIGRVFKIHSALEDSNPAPDGYVSGGILSDMGVHNVDEVLWLTGKMPRAALAIGARICSYRFTTCQEDFDDALLYLWFEGDLVAQIQVGRNHVSGYRVETVIFGEEGQIHIGHFDQKPFEILLEVYGRRGTAQPIAMRTFAMHDYGRPLPEYIDRFGPAYKTELEVFLDCCRSGAPFPTTHNDGLRAQAVIAAGMSAVVTPEQAGAIANFLPALS